MAEAQNEHALARDEIEQLLSLDEEMPGFDGMVAMLTRQCTEPPASSLHSTPGTAYEEAKRLGIEGRSDMTKDELAAALEGG